MLNTNVLGKQLMCIIVEYKVNAYVATNAFPHTTIGNLLRHGRATQNSWYDEECCESRRSLEQDVTRGICMLKQANVVSQCLSEEVVEIIFG